MRQFQGAPRCLLSSSFTGEYPPGSISASHTPRTTTSRCNGSDFCSYERSYSDEVIPFDEVCVRFTPCSYPVQPVSIVVFSGVYRTCLLDMTFLFQTACGGRRSTHASVSCVCAPRRCCHMVASSMSYSILRHTGASHCMVAWRASSSCICLQFAHNTQARFLFPR